MKAEKDRAAVGRHAGLVKGAAVLGAAAIISKVLGTMQKIPLQNLAGDDVFGIYNVVYPFYTLILFIATAGFPIAVSTFVSERATRGEFGEARRVLKIAFAILTATGILFFLLLFLGARIIAALIGVPATARAIQSVSFALLIVPAMAALRGYFQGLQDMVPTAVSQVVEQFVRVLTMVWLLLYFSEAGYGDSWIAAGATFGSVTGAVAGLIVMLTYWGRSRGTYAAAVNVTEPPTPARTLFKQFVAYALPICLGQVVLPILTIVDTFTMPRLLAARGGELAAMHDFGLYNHGIPLVQLIAMIATSMAAALVPAIAEARERNERAVIRVRTELAVRLTWLVALAASFGLAVLARPMNVMFYKSDEGSLAMAILAFTALFSTLNIVTSSILQGFGDVTAPAGNMLIAAAVKVAGNLALVPVWGIDGAAITAVVAFAVASGLNMIRIRRLTGAAFPLAANVVKPLVAVALMCAAIYAYMYCAEALLAWLPLALSYRAGQTIVALGAVAVGALVYTAALFRVEAVTRADLQLVPSLGGRILPVLVRLRWVK